MLTRRALGVAALCAALLTGCSGDDDPAPPDGSAGPERPLPTMGEDGLPADFPREEVPIVDGEVTSVKEGRAQDPGYALAVVVDAEPEDALEDAVSLLEGAGWERRDDGGGALVQVLRRDTDLVVVTSAPSSNRALVSYAIDLA